MRVIFRRRSKDDVGVRMRVSALPMLSRMVLSIEAKDPVFWLRRSVSTLWQRRTAASLATFFSTRKFSICKSGCRKSSLLRVFPPTTFLNMPVILLLAVPNRPLLSLVVSSGTACFFEEEARIA